MYKIDYGLTVCPNCNDTVSIAAYDRYQGRLIELYQCKCGCVFEVIYEFKSTTVFKEGRNVNM